MLGLFSWFRELASVLRFRDFLQENIVVAGSA